MWLCTAEATAAAAERPDEVKAQVSAERRTLEWRDWGEAGGGSAESGGGRAVGRVKEARMDDRIAGVRRRFGGGADIAKAKEWRNCARERLPTARARGRHCKTGLVELSRRRWISFG